MSLEAALQRLWYGPRWTQPAALAAGLAVPCRGRACAAPCTASALLRPQRVGVPVVVVGNITVGGTGKTPVAAWLARQLGAARPQGRRRAARLRRPRARPAPGRDAPTATRPRSATRRCCTRCAGRTWSWSAPIASRRRSRRRRQGAEIVVCDDGLQHLRLARDCEIAVVDAARGLGNGQLLPAGPAARAAGPARDACDAVVVTERGAAGGPRVDRARPARGHGAAAASAMPSTCAPASGGPLDSFRRARACTPWPASAIPEAFFDGPAGGGPATSWRIALADHAALDPAALPFPAGATVLMTEKDAVKCRSFAGADWWFVELGVAPRAGGRRGTARLGPGAHRPDRRGSTHLDSKLLDILACPALQGAAHLASRRAATRLPRRASRVSRCATAFRDARGRGAQAGLGRPAARGVGVALPRRHPGALCLDAAAGQAAARHRRASP